VIHIFICEDNCKQREYIDALVKKFILIEHYDMALTLSCGNPTELLNYLEKHPSKNNLYFLDIDLQHEINGITLASIIRERDAFGKIVFITTHAELSYLTFQYQIEAMDYIIKDKPDEIPERVKKCIDLTHSRYLDDDHPKRSGFQVKVGEQIQVIPFADILFFESHPTLPHKIILHTQNKQIEFRDSMSAVAKKAGLDFFRCDKSFVVNLKNIVCVDSNTREIEMKGGNTIFASVRKLKELLNLLDNI